MLPFFGIDALVVDDEGRELNKDKRSEGQLAVQQPWPCIFRRIIGGDNKEYTSTMIHDGLYFTGDRAARYPDGSFEFLGRSDNSIKVTGSDGVLQRLVQMEAVEAAVTEFGNGELVTKAYAVSKIMV
jgi:acetyl-CoA synthetase